MEYYLPDARDTIDPAYDFTREAYSPDRLRRDDLYAHEVLGEAPYDGMLVSLAMVEGSGRCYTAAERRRLYRGGLRQFARLPEHCKVMGDCGAFSYVNDEHPRFTPLEVADFYTRIGADLGFAVDHIVPGFSLSEPLFPEDEQRRRYDLTLTLAAEFFEIARDRDFEPIGVAQGWSPGSIASAVERLQEIGYDYVAIGGLVRMKTPQITALLRAIDRVRAAPTRIHLLGVARLEALTDWADLGVASFDSTSPLRRAWTDGRRNFWIGSEAYCALRVPHSDSPRVSKRIGAGEIDGDELRLAEDEAMDRMRGYVARSESLDATLDALVRYQSIHSPGADRRAEYARTLDARPWESCDCAICRDVGWESIVFRGSERNRRRGFHNVWNFWTQLRALDISRPLPTTRAVRVRGEGPGWTYMGWQRSTEEDIRVIAEEIWCIEDGECECEGALGPDETIHVDVHDGGVIETWRATWRGRGMDISRVGVSDPDLVIVGCGLSKLKCRARACDLYTGPIFRAHWWFAGQHDATIKIISALHVFVDPDDEIEPYDRTMSDLSPGERRSWARAVASEVEALVPVGGTVVAFAGAAYMGWAELLEGRTVLQPLGGLGTGARRAEWRWARRAVSSLRSGD